MKKALVLLILCFFAFPFLHAQRYIIRFKDKAFSSYSLTNPSAFLSPKAMNRRQRFNLSIDSTDLPVTSRYIDSLKIVPGVTILNASKWLNQVSILVSDAAALSKINSFPFVLNTSRVANRMLADVVENKKNEELIPMPLAAPAAQPLGDFFSYGNTYAQVHIHNGEFLHNIGLRGQNMIIGMLDAGYENYINITSLDSTRRNGQILGTWDFVAGNSNVADDYNHGTLCFSMLAGNVPGTFVGTAPKANYYLFRTEDVYSETPIEEHNWVCGAERIDSAGGDLISSSLGYMVFDDASLNYTYADMNGNTTMIARGADLAAKKGILVVNAAGNSGNDSWHYIISPADGDSVLAVGSVSATGTPALSSSWGPSSDGQVKPDVASMGVGAAVQFPNNYFGTSNGTSMACPNMAGLLTCLMQGFPEFSNMKIVYAVRSAGSIAATPDSKIGYGIPNLKKAVMSLIKDFSSASVTLSNCKPTISWTSKDVSAMKYEIERKAPNESSYHKIAERNGTGDGFATHSYQYIDTSSSITAGLVSYRIRQTIDTTTSGFIADYIDTATADMSSLCSLNDVVVLTPNPAKNHFFVQINSPEKIDNLSIQIVNMQGGIVDIIRKSKPAGKSNFNIPTPRLQNGQYYVSIYDGNVLLATKTLIIL